MLGPSSPRPLRSALLFTLLAACGGPAPEDPGRGGGDASDPAVVLDAGPTPDAAEAPTDAGLPSPDAAPSLDAEADAGTSARPDAGTAGDAAAPDASAADGGRRPDAGGAADAGAGDAGPAAPGVLNPGWIGGPCTSNADCPFAGGRCLTDAAGWPAGTCTQDCSRTCPDQSGPLNSVTYCIDDGNGDASGACVSRCDYTLSPTGCRDGYVCLPERRWSERSTLRYACVPETGVPGRAVPPFDIGEACASAADCERGTCISDLPNGYCTQEACDVVGCPSGAQCFALGLEGFHVCLRTCASSAECRQAESYGCDSDNTCWYVPPQRPACDFSGAASDCAMYAAQASSSSFVVVTKHQRRLAHCSGANLLGAYCVGLGSSPVDDKEREGDRRTPEGVFYIPRKIDPSQYYKAFLLSYPDAADAQRGYAAGLITAAERDAIVAAQSARREPPQQTNLGGYIELHGNGSSSDWTWGCIAGDDATIDVLWPDLQVGDSIVVLH